MNKLVEIMLTTLVLAGMYYSIPKSVPSSGSPVVQARPGVILADGSDPMPLCRTTGCRKKTILR